MHIDCHDRANRELDCPRLDFVFYAVAMSMMDWWYGVYAPASVGALLFATLDVMDVTPYFVAGVLVFGVWVLWVTSQRALFDRRLRTIKKTLGRKAAWEWYLTTPQWQRKRKACFRAFYGRCAGCGTKSNLQAHHCNSEAYDHLGHEKPIRDLTCLCATCHSKMPRSDGLFRA